MDDLRKALSDLKKCSSGMKKKRKDDEKTAKSELVVSLEKSKPGFWAGQPITVSGKGKFNGKKRPGFWTKYSPPATRRSDRAWGKKLADRAGEESERGGGFKTVSGKGKFNAKVRGFKTVSGTGSFNRKKSFEGIPDLSKSFSTDVIPLHIRNATTSSPINALTRR